MSYIDGFVIAVPTVNKQKFIEHAQHFDALFIELGAIRVIECWGDDVPDGKVTDFKRSVATEGDETVVFSWCEWPSKDVRDAAMKKMQADPEMQAGMKKTDQPMSMQRMIFGGFQPVIDERRAK